MLKRFNIEESSKAIIEQVGDTIVVRPKKDFWQLAGSLKSRVKLSDEQLRQARNAFSTKWPQK